MVEMGEEKRHSFDMDTRKRFHFSPPLEDFIINVIIE